MKKAAAWIVIVVIMIVIQTCQSRGDKKTEESQWERQKSLAFIHCKELVRKRLKAPSTADFPMLDFSVAKRSESGYLIKSYVDAQNSFGAKIRSEFHCDVEWNGLDPLAELVRFVWTGFCCR